MTTFKFSLTLTIGSWKERVAFVGRVLWSSFDDRFAQLLNRMKRHEAIFRQEMSLHDSKMMNVVQSRLDIYYDALQATLAKSFTKVDAVSEVVAAELLAKSKGLMLSIFQLLCGELCTDSISRQSGSYLFSRSGWAYQITAPSMRTLEERGEKCLGSGS